jgi:hypothetical protein
MRLTLEAAQGLKMAWQELGWFQGQNLREKSRQFHVRFSFLLNLALQDGLLFLRSSVVPISGGRSNTMNCH